MAYQAELRRRIDESRDRVIGLTDVTEIQLEATTLNKRGIIDSLHIQYRNLAERNALLSLYNALYDSELVEGERENARLLSVMEQKLKVVAQAASKSIRVSS